MKRIGVIMHGITGRMGYNQHLVRSVLAIRDQGGVVLKSGERSCSTPFWSAETVRKSRKSLKAQCRALDDRHRRRPCEPG